MTKSAISWDDKRAKPIPAAWVAPLKAWEEHLQAGGTPPATMRTRLDHARRMARTLGVSPDEADTNALVTWVAGQRWQRETRRSVYTSIRAFWAFMVQAGYTATDAAASLPLVRPAEPSPRCLPEQAYQDAVAHADDRLRLILRLAGEQGLRRGEIALVHANDLVDDLAGVTLIVHGKGAKDRPVPLSDDVARLVSEAVKAGGGWAFPGQQDGHLSPEHVGVLASRALTPYSLHQCRHRFGTRAYLATNNLYALQRLLGHTSPVTTERYVTLPADALRATMLAAA